MQRITGYYGEELRPPRGYHLTRLTTLDYCIYLVVIILLVAWIIKKFK